MHLDICLKPWNIKSRGTAKGINAQDTQRKEPPWRYGSVVDSCLESSSEGVELSGRLWPSMLKLHVR